MKETEQVENSINTKVEKIDKTIETTYNSAEIINHNSEGDSFIKVKVKPKAKLGALLKGDLNEAFGKSSVNLEFGKSFIDDNVEINIKVNGNLAAIMNSPSGSKKVAASFYATKKF